MAGDADHPFSPIVQHWMTCIRAGWEKKNERFGSDAAEARKFYTGPYQFFWSQLSRDRHFGAASDAVGVSEPSMKVQVNKVAELVQLFGPALYNRNPVRTVTPRTPVEIDPNLYPAVAGPQGAALMEQARMLQDVSSARDRSRASLVEKYLNYTPSATDLRRHGRMAVVDALISGMGLLWVEPYSPPAGGYRMVGSFQGDVDELVIDPDATSLRSAKWVARRRVRPVADVERERGLKPGSLAGCGSATSTSQGAALDATGQAEKWLNRQDGRSNDLIVYWQVWSKMGVGGRLPGVQPALRAACESFGEFCFIEVAEGAKQPINLPAELIQDPTGLPKAQQLLQWPTPYWADGGWPFAHLYFHDVPGSPWPLNHIAPAMGELKFLNWAYGHVAAKVRTTSRDFIAVLKSAGEEMKSKVLHGSDLELLEINEAGGKTIDQVVQFLQHPPFNGDIWTVIDRIQEQFDKRTGLTELMYGQTGVQMRSGTEAAVKSDQLNIRPDDMAEQVEAGMSLASRMEALCARWHLTPQDVTPVLGQVGSLWWDQLVYQEDPREIVFNLEYRVESGSTRKPNKSRDSANADAMMNGIFPVLQQYGAATGDLVPANTIIELWAKAKDVNQPERLFMKPVPPPMPAGPAAQQGGV